VSNVVQIVPLGKEYDRLLGVIKSDIPQKIYFIFNKEEERHEGDKHIFREIVDRLYETIKPLIDCIEQEWDQLDLMDCQIRLLEIVQNEREAGNRIIINISSGATPFRLASFFVSLFFDCELVWAMPEHYVPKEKKFQRTMDHPRVQFDFPLNSYGIKDILKFRPREYHILKYPNALEMDVLNEIGKEDPSTGSFKGTQIDLLNRIGKEKFGNKEQAQKVKISDILINLVKNKYISVDDVRKRKRTYSIEKKGTIAIRTNPKKCM